MSKENIAKCKLQNANCKMAEYRRILQPDGRAYAARLTQFAICILQFAICNVSRAADAPSPAVTISLANRQSSASPSRQGFTHTGGGNIDVSQPSADTIVITMTGVAVAGGHPIKNSQAGWNFDLNQTFEVAFADAKVKKAKLTVEGRVVGLLRSNAKGCGTAQAGPATATVSGGQGGSISLSMPVHQVGCGENLSINDHEGPTGAVVTAGTFTLHQSWNLCATHPKNIKPCKAISAEFAPDPALDPLWISYWEPFHGASKKDFGFQVTIKVAAE